MSAHIREATRTDAPSIARVHIDSWRATYRGIVADHVLDSLDYNVRAEYWQDLLSNPERKQSSFTLVAEVEGQIAGFADGGQERQNESGFDAELFAIYILPHRLRMGIGRRLLYEIAARMAAAGHRSLVVRVLASNPSRQFYERLGARLVHKSQIEIGGDTLELIAYGWYDLDSIQVP